MQRKMNLKKLIIILSVCLAIILFAAVGAYFVNGNMNKNVYITRYDFYSENTPLDFYGYKIAVISDMHNNVYADKFIQALDDEQPDAVVFLGDMIQLPDTDLGNVVKVIGSIKDKAKVYAVYGNHEASNGNAGQRKIFKTLSECGAKVLLNKYDDIKKDKDTIRIIGIKDTNDAVIDRDTGDKICKISNGLTDPNTLNIVLYHRADVYPMIKNINADLILSGHLHGGVVRLPFFGGVFGKKEGEYFPKYTSGTYNEGNAEMIVSRGCDYNPEKMRVFNPPEIVTVTLHGKKSADDSD